MAAVGLFAKIEQQLQQPRGLFFREFPASPQPCDHSARHRYAGADLFLETLEQIGGHDRRRIRVVPSKKRLFASSQPREKKPKCRLVQGEARQVHERADVFVLAESLAATQDQRRDIGIIV